MRNKLGSLLIVLGALLIAAALALLMHNHQEQLRAASASQQAIPKVVEAIHSRHAEPEPSPEPEDPAEPVPDMAVVEIDGYDYIGFLGIPSLELELPIMSDWSHTQLQIAPCRYAGSTYTNDMVLMAHNYDMHFGRIRDLKTDDIITFTDMDGKTIEYRVVALDVLAADAVEEMIAGEYDLSLFTCTYGGHSRVTVRCDRDIS